MGIKLIFLYGLLFLTAILSLSTLVWWSFPLELLSNFRVYYLLLASAIAMICFLYQIKGWCSKLPLLLALGLVAFNSVWVLPWYLPHSQQGSGNLMRVLTFNINTQNDQWDAIAKSVRAVKPDIATILETSAEAQEKLSQRLDKLLPFVYRASGGGITIFSRFPLISSESKRLNNGTVLVTSVQINQKVIELVAVHPMVPVKPNLFKRRNAFLAEVAAYLQQQQKKPLIFLGDFNLTPWSPYYFQLIRSTKLHNTRLGFGIEPSWIEPATHVHYPQWLTRLIKIPIDHIFVSADFKVSNCKTMKAANSDHRILWADLAMF
jgi:endonuclease/exonuclease/phosphatase (EEP) superfamily protein YafD